jgi:hypothetical protein
MDVIIQVKITLQGALLYLPPLLKLFHPMKQLNFFLLFSFAVCLGTTARGQVVHESVTFDNYVSASDNDFENRFDNGPGLTQVQANGITGGCLETPQTISWGNANAIYCTRFKGVIGESYSTGICFKYDTTQLNNINFDRPVTLWMKPYIDPNHYIVASVLDSRQIQVISYSASASSAVMQLVHGHWYNLLLVTDFTGGGANDEIDINAQVNDLGVTGNDPPIPVSFANTVLHDSITIADSSIEVSIDGTLWGGARYLDNFRFDGMKSFDNCISTAVEENTPDNILVTTTASMLTVNTGNIQNGTIEIYDVHGNKVAEKKICSGMTELEISAMSSGIYLLSIKNEKYLVTKKIVLN